jgi:hypothetical protein
MLDGETEAYLPAKARRTQRRKKANGHSSSS